jgi:deoxyribodipyrimidine photolyase-related protein
MSALCVILGDQLSMKMSSLQAVNKDVDTILMAEVKAEASYVKHHKTKIAYVFSAMRHFAQQLVSEGYSVEYVKYNDERDNSSIYKVVEQIVSTKNVTNICISKPAEYRLFEDVSTWDKKLGISTTIYPDNRFIATEERFKEWADGRKQLRMEYFYREMRKEARCLMDGDKPIGGKWNFDAENREKLPKEIKPPLPTMFEPDEITKDVIDLVSVEFSEHFGDLDNFHYAVTREDALIVLNEFIDQRLPNFGQYQDAMVQDEPWMYHSHISFYLNSGLLMPLEIIDAAEQAYYNEKAPLNSVEGFIRQILGWREYVRGFYWYMMPGYTDENYLQASRKLPDFYWTGDTSMNCISQSVKQTKEHAYAHHIQRLMVLGNFALLAGIDPKYINEWYLIVYGDAYEWVELPNVSGMVLFADGGKLASKPYAASGAYIHKMSNYCEHCEYSVKEKSGPQACPFNYLYWGFINKHADKFKNNPRMAMIYKTMLRMDEKKLSHMLEDSELFLKEL